MSEAAHSPAQQPIREGKVGIIGIGYVGATFAYSLAISGAASEIVLVDVNKEKALGEAMDLNHGLAFINPVRIYSGDYADCADAQVIVLTAGAAQREGESRLDLLARNAKIFADICPQITAHTRSAVLLVVTNPVDILTYLTLKFSGLPPSQVLGSGTILDTARFRFLLGQHYGVDPRSVHAYILGEHGDSEVPIWSTANIAGSSLSEYCQLTGLHYNQAEMDRLFEQVRGAAYELIKRKGVSNYAIGLALTRLVEAIVRDQNRVFSVSSLVQDYYGIGDVCFSLPCVVGRQGVRQILRLHLSAEEVAALARSAEILKSTLRRLNGA